MADGIRCSRCEQVLEPEAFAPSQRKPGAWCRECRRGYMRSYMATYEAKPKPACWKCKAPLPLVGGCFNGCGQRITKAPPVLRTATCLICSAPFILPVGANGKLRTCRAPRCRAVRMGQRRAATLGGRWVPRRRVKKLHHRGSYQVRARNLTLAAYADTATRCWRCGRTLQDHPPHKNGKPARWTAGHIRDGEVDGTLLPEASTCNFSAGAIARNTKHAAWTDLTW